MLAPGPGDWDTKLEWLVAKGEHNTWLRKISSPGLRWLNGASILALLSGDRPMSCLLGVGRTDRAATIFCCGGHL